MKPTLSKGFLSWLNSSSQSEEELRDVFEARLKSICKPCWELKYCPYGPLVVDYPLPPITVADHTAHIEYLKQCLEHDAMGDNFDIPLDDLRRELFRKYI